jgi:hypothetical protein
MSEWMVILSFILSLATPTGYAGYKIFKNCKFKFTIESSNHDSDDDKDKPKSKSPTPKSPKHIPVDFRYYYPQYYGYNNPQLIQPQYGNIPIQHIPPQLNIHKIPIQQHMNQNINFDNHSIHSGPVINTDISRYTNSLSQSLTPRNTNRSISPSAVSAHARINSNHVPIIVSRNVQTRQRSSSSSNTQNHSDVEIEINTNRRNTNSTNTPNSYIQTVLSRATNEI